MTKLLYDRALGGFPTPIALPETPKESRQWQDAEPLFVGKPLSAIRLRDHIGGREFSPAFCCTLDIRFCRDVKTFMPSKNVPLILLILYGAGGIHHLPNKENVHF
jgi:hypothetical protein